MALASLNMLGQTISGNVVGTVIDASGAAVVGADVEATNVETNVVTRTKTNGKGEYQIENLLSGAYHEACGLRASSRLRKMLTSS